MPVLVDALYYEELLPTAQAEPPKRDGLAGRIHGTTMPGCFNRHEGGVNVLFRDGSVRKVGLKELWKLYWYPGFDTSGPWTLAGGVQREDWPEWMRRFEDY